MSEGKQDLLDRKIDGVVKLAKLDSVKVMLIISVFFNIYQYYDNRSLNKNIVDEIRRQVPGVVEEKVAPIEEGWNHTRDKIDTLIEKAKQ